jgi:hypothetical protein
MHEKGGILHKLFNTYYKKEYQRRKFCRYQRDIFNSINRRRKHIAMNKRRRTYNDITQKTKEQTRGTYLKLRVNSGTSQG